MLSDRASDLKHQPAVPFSHPVQRPLQELSADTEISPEMQPDEIGVSDEKRQPQDDPIGWPLSELSINTENPPEMPSADDLLTNAEHQSLQEPTEIDSSAIQEPENSVTTDVGASEFEFDFQYHAF